MKLLPCYLFEKRQFLKSNYKTRKKHPAKWQGVSLNIKL